MSLPRGTVLSLRKCLLDCGVCDRLRCRSCERSLVGSRGSAPVSDELRHSLLAWSFVRWAHKQDPRRVDHLIELTINTLSKPAPRAQVHDPGP